MSSINTNSIDVSYPSPGVNNSSQGFRDNFAGIKNNIEIAKTELADLQKNVLVKGALSGTTMANDMNGGIISNVLQTGTRRLTYSLGSNLSGTVGIDVSLGEVHHGIVVSNISLMFTKWATTEQQQVDVKLQVSKGQKIYLPSNVKIGIDTLEGYDSVNHAVLVPYGVSDLHFVFITSDCGTNITVSVLNRPRQSTQVAARTFDVIANANVLHGESGDMEGDVAYYGGNIWVCHTSYVDGSANIWQTTPEAYGITAPEIVSMFNKYDYPIATIRDVTAENIIANTNITVGGNIIVSGKASITGVANITGNINASGALTVTGKMSLGSVSNISIPGGNSGQYLRTDGTGNLTWADAPGNGSTGSGTVVSAGIGKIAYYSNTGASVSGLTEMSWTSNGLSVSGNITADNIKIVNTLSIADVVASGKADLKNANVQLAVSTVHIDGGTSGQYLQTNGNGTLTWATVTNGSGGSGTVASGTVAALAVYTAGTTVGSASGLTWTSGTSTFDVNGNITSTNGNITLTNGNITLSTGNISAKNITATGDVEVKTNFKVNGTTNLVGTATMAALNATTVVASGDISGKNITASTLLSSPSATVSTSLMIGNATTNVTITSANITSAANVIASGNANIKTQRGNVHIGGNIDIGTSIVPTSWFATSGTYTINFTDIGYAPFNINDIVNINGIPGIADGIKTIATCGSSFITFVNGTTTSANTTISSSATAKIFAKGTATANLVNANSIVVTGNITATGNMSVANLFSGNSTSNVTIANGVITTYGNITATGTYVTGKLITTSTVPPTATSTGVAGQIAYDTNYVYVCVATNTWKRSSLASW
jgi:hypothetical protein